MNITTTQNIIHKSFICLKSFATTEKKFVENYISKQNDKDKYFTKNCNNNINLYKFI